MKQYAALTGDDGDPPIELLPVATPSTAIQVGDLAATGAPGTANGERDTRVH
jgi:hypothetical protein